MEASKASIVSWLLIFCGLPVIAAADEDRSPRISEVDFSNCVEFAGGLPVSKSALEQQVPSQIAVKSLTDLGFVFPGSDDLGILIVRALRCESIAVSFRNGKMAQDEDRSFVHVGTPIFADNLPSTPFNLDGNNGADFNNYTFRYFTDSSVFKKALRRGGFRDVSLTRRITFEDLDTDASVCGTAVRLVDVPGQDAFAVKVAGIVTEANAACHAGAVDVVANWWTVNGKKVAVTSNQIISQTLLPVEPSTVMLVADEHTTLGQIVGTRTSTFSAFLFSGFIPSPEPVDMVIGPVGALPW